MLMGVVCSSLTALRRKAAVKGVTALGRADRIRGAQAGVYPQRPSPDFIAGNGLCMNHPAELQKKVCYRAKKRGPCEPQGEVPNALQQIFPFVNICKCHSLLQEELGG